jgi:uncharacterized protein involved in exopolysaccharide biosynthesis
MSIKASTAKASPIHDDEIDLRAIFETLWKSRWVIVIVTLIAAVLTFSVSFWILPRTYEATSYVFIGNPVVEFVNAPGTTGITISPILPDIKAVVKLATAPGLLEGVLKDPSINAAFSNEEIAISNLESMTVASDLGKDQISLLVTDTDPQRAALLANTWAEKLTDTVNATYGLGAMSTALDSQVSQSLQDYEQAQAILSDALSTSQLDALNAQLKRRQADLNCVLDSASQTMRVVNDLQALEKGLSSMAAEAPLSLGDGLALTTLRQRSLTSQPCQLADQSQSSSGSVPSAPDFTAQIDSAAFAGFTVSKALETAVQMRSGLQTQLTRLQEDQSRLEQEIPQLQRDLDNANEQLSQFKLNRDQSQDLYQALLLQQQRVATVLKQSAKVATISIGAVPPDKKSSPKVVSNTLLAGILGLLVSLLAVLAVDWYRSEPGKLSRL